MLWKNGLNITQPVYLTFLVLLEKHEASHIKELIFFNLLSSWQKKSKCKILQWLGGPLLILPLQTYTPKLESVAISKHHLYHGPVAVFSPMLKVKPRGLWLETDDLFPITQQHRNSDRAETKSAPKLEQAKPSLLPFSHQEKGKRAWKEVKRVLQLHTPGTKPTLEMTNWFSWASASLHHRWKVPSFKE